MVKVKGERETNIKGRKKFYIIIESTVNGNTQKEFLTVSEKQYNNIIKLLTNEHINTLDKLDKVG